jgi:hypothetical protein
MDLAKCNMTELADMGANMSVRLPDGSVSDWVIACRGRDSTEYNKKIAEWRHRRKGGGKPTTEADDDREAAEGIAACVVSWSGATMKGEPFECTPENVYYVLTDNAFKFVADQIIEFVMNRANFFKGAESK